MKKRAPIGEKDDLTDEEKSKLEHVLRSFERADKYHRLLRSRWNLYYGLYRNYRKLGRDLKQSNPRDRDTISQEFVRVFGAELFIPYAFSTVETILPRILSTNPKMLALPRNQDGEHSIEPVQAVFARDQKAIKYSLKLQDTVKSSLMYGLGVQKTYWNKEYRNGRKFEPRSLHSDEMQVKDDRRLVYEGPQAEDIDIFDFFWDPAAKDIATCGFVIHRLWRSTEYVADKVKCGDWSPLNMEMIKKNIGDQDRGGIWSDRMEAAGLKTGQENPGYLHEILEFHDREKVYTVLDRSLLVQDKRNPHHHGDYCFQIARTRRVPNEFCGIGEIEPIAHLQFELNTMRSQRRDAATLALNRGYFYRKGGIQKKDMITGPNAMVPVNDDPKDVMWPMPLADIPASSVSEEEALKADITLTTGISETFAGTAAPTSGTTGTEVQLMQAAVGERIKLSAQNVLDETVTDQAEQFRELYIQKYPSREGKDASVVRIADTLTPSGYSFVDVGREDFMNTEIIPEAGSMAPENEAEKKANVTNLTQALAPVIERIDPAQLAKWSLEQFGINTPDSWILPEPQGPDPLVELMTGLVQVGELPQPQVMQLLGTISEQVEPGSPEFMEAVMGELVNAGMEEQEAVALLEEIAQPQQEPQPA